MGAPFVYLGYQAVKEPGGRVAMATNFGIPEEYADVAVRANGAVMVLGGLSVATGLCPRLGAAAVAGAMCRPRWPGTPSGRTPIPRSKQGTSPSSSRTSAWSAACWQSCPGRVPPRIPPTDNAGACG